MKYLTDDECTVISAGVFGVRYTWWSTGGQYELLDIPQSCIQDYQHTNKGIVTAWQTTDSIPAECRKFVDTLHEAPTE